MHGAVPPARSHTHTLLPLALPRQCRNVSVSVCWDWRARSCEGGIFCLGKRARVHAFVAPSFSGVACASVCMCV